MIIKDNMANMCAKVTSTYMEFTLAFGPKLEFSFSFKFLIYNTTPYLKMEEFFEHLFCFLGSFYGNKKSLPYSRPFLFPVLFFPT